MLQTLTLRPRGAEPSHNLFFAAQPPAPVADRIEQVWRLAGTDSHFRASTLHLTVLGVEHAAAIDPWLVDHLRHAMAGFHFAPFTLVFDRLQTFRTSADRHDRRDFPIVLATETRDEAMNAFANALRQRLFPARRGRVAVTPHVTLAYGPGFAEDRLLASPVRWTVTDITLIDSHVGLTRHVPLGRWPLVPARPGG